MSEAAAPRDTRQLEMLEAMTECAFALAMAAGEMAKRAGDDTARFVAACTEFRHCSFAVRMGIRMAHGAFGPARLGRPAAEPAEHERAERLEQERPERPEGDDSRDAPERDEVERERDRDYEPVSLPQFLKTLGLAAASAERRRDELPPHIRDTILPTLQGLLREAKASPDPTTRGSAAGAAVAILARSPPATPPGRARLLTSTVAPIAPPLRPKALRRPSG
jgi:hypothetical protein